LKSFEGLVKNYRGKRIKNPIIPLFPLNFKFFNYQKSQPKNYLEQKITENPEKLAENYRESK